MLYDGLWVMFLLFWRPTKSANPRMWIWVAGCASLAMGMQHVPAVSGLSRLMGRSHGSSYTHVPWRVVL